MPYPKHLEDAALPQVAGDRRSRARSWWAAVAEFRMPVAGRRHARTGTLVQWLVKPGDRDQARRHHRRRRDRKGAIDIEVFQNGILQSIVVQEGEKVPVGTTMALIAADGEAPAPAPPKPQPIAAPAAAAATTRSPPRRHPGPPLHRRLPAPRRVEKPAPAAPGRLRISPLAMRVALELGVNPATLKGTGPGGAITRFDVESRRQGSRPLQRRPLPPRRHPRRPKRSNRPNPGYAGRQAGGDAPRDRRGDGALRSARYRIITSALKST